MGISRQALSSHLRKLKGKGFIRTGRGFIDITEKGLAVLGASDTMAFVFLKVSLLKREAINQRLQELPVQQILSVKGDMDFALIVEPDNLDETLKSIRSIRGVEETKSYLTTEVIK